MIGGESVIRLRNDTGFSLVELMIVVAIIAVLAAIAITKFDHFQLTSKTSEATAHLALIRTAQFSYKAENDVFMECGPSPPAPAGTDGSTHVWAETPNSSLENGFEKISFEPDGVVRYQYEVSIAKGRFVATAIADLDNDGVLCTFTLDNLALGYSKPVRDPVNEF